MRRIPLIAGIAAGLCAGLPVRAERLPDAATQVRIDADSWEALGRADLAQLALDKLLLTRPGDIRLMFEIGQLNLRLNQVEAASKILDRMTALAPAAAETAQLTLAVRNASRDRLRLAGVRRLVEIARYEEAARELRALFPDGPPDGDLGVTYYRILFENPADRQRARAGLAALAARWPDQRRYQIALADLMTRDRESRAEGLRQLETLAVSTPAPSAELLDLWRRSLMRGAADSASRRSAARYLTLAHDDAEFKSWRERRETASRRYPGSGDGKEREPPLPDSLKRAIALRQQAMRADSSTAIDRLQDALQLAPADPFLRLDLIVRLRAAGDAAAADRLNDQALQRVAGALPSRIADNAEARRLQVEAIGLAADAEDARQHGGAATALLERALTMTPDDPWLRFRLARRYLANGVPGEARALMAEGLARSHAAKAPDSEMRFAFGLILESLDDPDSVLAVLEPIPGTARSDGMQALSARAQRAQASRALDRLLAAGDQDGAAARLKKAEAGPLDDPETVRSIAAAWRKLGRPADGIALLDRSAAGGQPATPEQRVLLAELLDDLASQDRLLVSDADTRLAALLPTLAGDAALAPDQQQRIATLQGQQLLRVADRQFAAGDRAAGFATLDQAIAARPDDLALRDARAERLLDARRYDTALLDLRAVAAGSDEAWRAGRARDRIADLDSRRDGFVAIGPSLRDRPGPAGRSRFTNSEIPLQLRWSLGVDRAVFAHVDRVQASAGRLPAVYDDAALFGQVQAQGPASLTRFPDGDRQTSSGVVLAAGWLSDTLRVDVGTTPIGFPVVDVVGGLRWSDRRAGLNVSAELARRPLTNSLLSYGGARDPATGRSWGGARNQRLRLRLAEYGDRLSYNASLEAGVVTGRALPSNRQLQLTAGVDWKFISTATQKLVVGLDTRYWNYQRNLGEFTWGHGGYYSPQHYAAIGVPVEWQGRIGRLSYRLRGALSLSYDQIDETPFYPGDAALQAQALASPLPTGFSAPVYAANSGPGFGRSLSGAAEYALTPLWSLGASFDIDRAAFYAPNFFSFYLRRSFLPQSLLRALPPRPPEPYSSY